MTDFKPPFIKLEMKGVTVLVNTNHIAWAHFKGTAITDLHMSNGEIIEVKHTNQLLGWIRQQYNNE